MKNREHETEPYRPLRNQRGQAMAGIGVGLLAFFALTAVAVDLGHLALTATEVQTAADAAATAGARQLLNDFKLGRSRDEAKTDVESGTSDGFNVGQANPVAGAAPDSIIIEAGNCDPTAHPCFRPDDPNADPPIPLNAVRATIATTVPNIVASICGPVGFCGSLTSTVTKVATAAVNPITSAIPQLPFVIDSCAPFDQAPDCANPETQHLLLGNLPNHSDSTGWTTYGGLINDPDIYALLPTQCSANGISGGGGTMPLLTANSADPNNQVGIIEAYRRRSTDILADCVQNEGMDTFLVPVMRCGSDPTSAEAPVGFGTIKILAMDTITNPTVPTMDVQLICAATDRSGSGGSATDFGTGFIAVAE